MNAKLLPQWARQLQRRRGGFPLRARGPITALDWDGEVLRVAQSVQHGGKAELCSLAVGRLDSPLLVGKDEPRQCGARLAQALAEIKLKPEVVVMGIPRSLVFLRTLSLPKPPSPADLPAMVHFQVSKELPFRAEDAVIDFQANAATLSPAPSASHGEAAPNQPAESAPVAERVEVLVAVVKREVVQFYQQMAEAAGLTLAALGLDSYANARGLAACGPPEQPRLMALVSLRQAEVITDILVEGALAFSRTAPLGAATTDSLEQITIEVVRSLHNFEGLERHERVEQIVVTGANPLAARVVEALSQRCQCPCRRLEPLGACAEASTTAAQQPEALTVLSLALMAQDTAPWAFDFLHPKRPAIRRNVRRLSILSGVGAAVVVLGTALGIRTHLLHQRLAARDQVAAEVELAAKNRPAYQQMRLRSKLVHDWMLEKREWLDHYARLSTLLPDCSEVYVTSISTGAKGVLHISIRARNGDVLAQIDHRLRAAGYDPKPLAATPSADRYGYPFQSSLELTLPDKMQINLSALKVPPRPATDGSLETGKPPAEHATPATTPVDSRDKSLERPGRRKRP